MLARLADAFVLQPTTHPIPVDGKTRRTLESDSVSFEVWIQNTNIHKADDPDLFVLKFPGTGGRAERMSEHPADRWDDLACEIWTVNPPGYGGSGGRASLRFMVPTATSVYEELSRRANGRPILVTGNSLGCLPALYLAAQREVCGVLARNPPPLKQLITERYGRWSFGLAKFIADQVPEAVCSISNAAQSQVPALFLTSEQDRTVPPDLQRHVIDNYAGERRVMQIGGADHATPIDESQFDEYAELLEWLRATAI